MADDTRDVTDAPAPVEDEVREPLDSVALRAANDEAERRLAIGGLAVDPNMRLKIRVNSIMNVLWPPGTPAREQADLAIERAIDGVLAGFDAELRRHRLTRKD